MPARRSVYITGPLVVLILTCGHAFAQSAGRDTAEAAILKRAEAFVDTFGRGDAKALAAFWAPDGDYVDQTGRRLTGRGEIEKAFADLFSRNDGLTLRIEIESFRMVTPDVAVEDGTTEVIPPDGSPPSRARYTIMHVRQDGQWYLDSVREAVYTPPSQYEHLRTLEWLIGDWEDETDSGEVARVSLAWTDDQNFIISSFTTTIKDISVAAGTQWVGWDASRKQIRSWTFESSGGFGEGVWAPNGNKVVITTNSVLPDGRKLSATEIVTRVDADTLTWQSTNRSLDGEALPDIPEVRMTRGN